MNFGYVNIIDVCYLVVEKFCSYSSFFSYLYVGSIGCDNGNIFDCR